MPNIFSSVFSGVVSALRNPWYALFTLLIVLFFPLNLVDYLIWAILSAGVAVLNAIIWIVVAILNAIIWFLNSILSAIEFGLESAPLNMDIGDIPALEKLAYFSVGVPIVDIFSETANIFTIILGLFGISFPIW